MNLACWVPELAAEFQVAPSELKDGLFLYTPRGNVTAAGVHYECAPDCYIHLEENGVSTCTCEVPL